MKCNHCGAENENGAIFCDNCGKKIEAPAAPPKNICPHCGAENEEGAVFCDSCGQRIGRAPAPTPRPAAAPKPSYSQPAPPSRPQYSQPRAEERPYARPQNSYGHTGYSQYIQCGDYLFTDTERILNFILVVGAFIEAGVNLVTMFSFISGGAPALQSFGLVIAAAVCAVGAVFVLKFQKWAHIMLLCGYGLLILLCFATLGDNVAVMSIIEIIMTIGLVVIHIMFILKMSDTTQSMRR